MTEIVRQTPVKNGTVDLLVSTARAHEGRQYGPYIIDKLNIRSDTRDDAMDEHREALYAARTEQPT